jgi:sugar phosphate isomerase/epimerase
MDAGIHFAIENHKDLTCWETRQIIDSAGREFVASYLDTGNPVFILEDPMQAVETLGPVAMMLHLRDSVVYESRNGIAVQWVPLGEGVVDFKAIIAKAKELCPEVPVYIKPITGRPPAITGKEGASLRIAHGHRGCAGSGSGGIYRGAYLSAERAHGAERRVWEEST